MAGLAQRLGRGNRPLRIDLGSDCAEFLQSDPQGLCLGWMEAIHLPYLHRHASEPRQVVEMRISAIPDSHFSVMADSVSN